MDELAPVIVFKLMPNRADDNGFVVNDFEERDIAAVTERNDQFAGKRTLTDFAAGEWRPFEELQPGANRIDGTFG